MNANTSVPANEKTPMGVNTNPAIIALRQACHCLALEVHESIVKDVRQKAEAVIALIPESSASVPTATDSERIAEKKGMK